MRIKITLAAFDNGRIDFNYQHQIQSVIYRFLANSSPDYATWLHESGYVYQRDQRFKFFVYSGIIFNGPVKVLNGFNFQASQTHPFTFYFKISSPVNRFLQHLIEGIFKEGQDISLGHQKVIVHQVETLPDPLSSLDSLNSPGSLNSLKDFILRPLESPLFVKKPMPRGERDLYLFPGDADYEAMLNQNLVHKYETLHGQPYKGDFLSFNFHNINGKTEKQFIIFKKGPDGDLKTVNIKGTLKPFSVSGPEELIKIGLECGFGQNNSIGCGYVEPVQTV